MANNNVIFDPTPPEPITNACVFCGESITDEILREPGTLCSDCHRPTCPSCIEDLKQTGLWGCWYCSTVDVDERNPQIQKELEKIRKEKLRERQHDPVLPVTPYITTTNQVASTSGTTSWNWQNSSTSPPRSYGDEYPHRDPPNLLDREEGWGVAPADWDGDKIMPPGSGKEAEDVIKEEAQRGTGRTVQRVKSIFGHFLDGSIGLRKNADERRLLFLVDTQSMVGRIKEVIRREYSLAYHERFGKETLEFISSRVDLMPVGIALSGGTIGKRYTLVIGDLALASVELYGKALNRMVQRIGAPFIGEVIKG